MQTARTALFFFLLCTTTGRYVNAAYQIFVTSSVGQTFNPLLFSCISTCEGLATTCEKQKWVPNSRRYSFADAVAASVCFDKCYRQRSSGNVRVTTAMSDRELSDDVHEETFAVYNCISERSIANTDRKPPETLNNSTSPGERRAFAVFVPTSDLCMHAGDFKPPANFHDLVSRAIRTCDIAYQSSVSWTTARITWPFSSTVTLSQFCAQPHTESMVHMLYTNEPQPPKCLIDLLESFLSVAPDTRLVSTMMPSTSIRDGEHSKLWLYMDTTMESDHVPYTDELDLLPCMNTDHEDTVSWLPSWKLASYDRLFNLNMGRYNRTKKNKEGKAGNPIWLQLSSNIDQATRCALVCAVSGLRFAWKFCVRARVACSGGCYFRCLYE
jgi:hypothetical protein